jgi:hypothetical protein
MVKLAISAMLGALVPVKIIAAIAIRTPANVIKTGRLTRSIKDIETSAPKDAPVVSNPCKNTASASL